MRKKKIRPAKKCEKCGKILREYNKSGLCSHHLGMKLTNELRKERKEQGLCIQCGKKVEPISPVRCYLCRQNQKENRQKRQSVNLTNKV